MNRNNDKYFYPYQEYLASYVMRQLENNLQVERFEERTITDKDGNESKKTITILKPKNFETHRQAIDLIDKLRGQA